MRLTVARSCPPPPPLKRLVSAGADKAPMAKALAFAAAHSGNLLRGSVVCGCALALILAG